MQGRLLAAAVQFVLAAMLWVVWLGWIVHIWSIVDAARYTPPARPYGDSDVTHRPVG